MFHDLLWSDVVEQVFGHRAQHLLAFRGERLIGVLPLMEVRSLLGGRMLVSVPYATAGGALTQHEAADALLAEAAEQLCRDRGACVVDVRSPRRRFQSWPCDDRYVGFVRTLPERIGDIDLFLPRKARAAARQAETRERLTVRHDIGELSTIWRLYTRSMRRLGTINYPWHFFEALRRAYGERMWVSSVWDGARPVCGVVSFADRDVIRPYFAGADERIRATGSTNLLYRELMRRAVDAGLRRFDFGRTRRQNAGAFEFKCNQGFEPAPLGYQRFCDSERNAPDLTPSNARFALARKVWPMLPLSLTQALGGWLARSIPG